MMQTFSSRSAYPSSPGIYNLTTDTAAGDTVQYTLRIPEAYDGQTALPVIVCLHFGGQASDFSWPSSKMWRHGLGSSGANRNPVKGGGSVCGIDPTDSRAR